MWVGREHRGDCFRRDDDGRLFGLEVPGHIYIYIYIFEAVAAQLYDYSCVYKYIGIAYMIR